VAVTAGADNGPGCVGGDVSVAADALAGPQTHATAHAAASAFL
jgi:hypothetical protein